MEHPVVTDILAQRDATVPVIVAPTTTYSPDLRLGSVVMALRGITRRFGAVVASDGIDLEVKAGEVLVVVGDNGAGKTTLMNILSGHDAADAGSVLAIDGLDRLVPLPAGAPRAALQAGIAMVEQPAALAENLTALENIMLGAHSPWRPYLPRRSARRRLTQLMQRLKVTIDLDLPVADLPARDRLYVAILRAFYRSARIMVLALDEPAAALTPVESESLFRTLQALASSGLAVVVTARKPDDALALADRVVVLRDGRMLADLSTDDPDYDILEALISDRAPQKVTPTFHPGSRPILELRKVDAAIDHPRSALQHASIEVKSGEVVGIAGVDGNGQDALVALATGKARPKSGEVYLFGRRLARFDTAAFVRVGIGRIPKERRIAAFASMSVVENLALGDIGLPWLHRFGILKGNAIRAHTREIVDAYGLDCPDPSAPVGSLPTRTIDQLVLFRMLDRKPHLIVADHPTRALPRDMVAEFHRQIDFERNNGAAILLISDDIDELLALSDLISVIHRGRITMPQPTGAFDRTQMTSMMGNQGSRAQEWAGWGE
jgi:simple sugar transport system ATP-binding protein